MELMHAANKNFLDILCKLQAGTVPFWRFLTYKLDYSSFNSNKSKTTLQQFEWQVCPDKVQSTVYAIIFAYSYFRGFGQVR